MRMFRVALLPQIRSLRTKLKESRSTVEQLTTELSNLKISMHEREAEMATALRSSLERPGSGEFNLAR